MQVYTLEKVLKLKKDAITQASFLDEAMTVRSSVFFNHLCSHYISYKQVIENQPSLMFWTTLSHAFEVQAKEAVRGASLRLQSSNPLLMERPEGSAFIQTTLSSGYPRLLRLFQEFFSTIAAHTDTIYSQTQQSCVPCP